MDCGAIASLSYIFKLRLYGLFKGGVLPFFALMCGLIQILIAIRQKYIKECNTKL